MVRINFLDLNRASGLFGLLLLSIAVSLIFFSIAYFIEGAGWSNAAEEEEEDYGEIAGNWNRGGTIALVLAGFLFVGSGVLFLKNFLYARKVRELIEPKKLL